MLDDSRRQISDGRDRDARSQGQNRHGHTRVCHACEPSVNHRSEYIRSGARDVFFSSSSSPFLDVKRVRDDVNFGLSLSLDSQVYLFVLARPTLVRFFERCTSHGARRNRISLSARCPRLGRTNELRDFSRCEDSRAEIKDACYACIVKRFARELTRFLASSSRLFPSSSLSLIEKKR